MLCTLFILPVCETSIATSIYTLYKTVFHGLLSFQSVDSAGNLTIAFLKRGFVQCNP